MIQSGFSRSKYDSCVYFKKESSKKSVYLLLFVDDMLLASLDKAEIEKLKQKLKNRFEMKDLGPT